MENIKSELSDGERGGNTKPPRPPSHQLVNWFFTLPMEVCTARALCANLKEHCKKFTFQGEEGKQGFKHWQGNLSLKKRLRMHEVKNLISNKIHLEGTKDVFAADNYCSKSETRIEGPYSEKSEFIEIIENLREWQKKLEIELLEKPNDRKIIWICDNEGNMGKTVFCKYMAIKHKATIIQSGKKSDIAYMIDNPKIVLFNLSRTQESRINYDAIESIKDGMIMSSKYESKMKIFNPPHVIIMSNFMPDINMMSKDRWDIREYGKCTEPIVQNMDD